MPTPRRALAPRKRHALIGAPARKRLAIDVVRY
jgi:hypothetical protein